MTHAQAHATSTSAISTSDNYDIVNSLRIGESLLSGNRHGTTNIKPFQRAATGTDDENRLPLVCAIAVYAETVEESLVGSDRRQRQRRGFGKAEFKEVGALITEALDGLELRIAQDE